MVQKKILYVFKQLGIESVEFDNLQIRIPKQAMEKFVIKSHVSIPGIEVREEKVTPSKVVLHTPDIDPTVIFVDPQIEKKKNHLR